MTDKLYGDPKQMNLFEDMEKALLEAIEMEHGEECRERVKKESDLSKEEIHLITQYNHLIATGQIASAVEFLNANPSLLGCNLNLLIDEQKEVIDKMNKVPNNLYIEEDRGQELILEPEQKGRWLCQHPSDSVIPPEVSKKLWEFAKDPFAFLTEDMRDATPEEREYINKRIKEISYPTGVCFWENWHLRENNETAINEIDNYIAKVNSQDNYIAEVNSLPMPENYPHEDDNFYIPEEYLNMTAEELEIEKEKLLKELKRRKRNEKNCKI